MWYKTPDGSLCQKTNSPSPGTLLVDPDATVLDVGAVSHLTWAHYRFLIVWCSPVTG